MAKEKESVIAPQDLKVLEEANAAPTPERKKKKKGYMPPPRSALKPGTHRLPSGLVIRNA